MASDPTEELPELVVPTIDTDDEAMDAGLVEVDYSDRAPDDWVSSGPLGEARGAGRRFADWAAAERWARRFYGQRFKRRVDGWLEDSPRWAFVIRGRGTGNG